MITVLCAKVIFLPMGNEGDKDKIDKMA